MTRPAVRVLLSVLAIGLLAAGCGGDDDTADEPVATATPAESSQPAEQADPTTEPAEEPTTAADPQEETPPSPLADAGVVTIAIEDASGAQPVLTWDPVPGAASYHLVIRDNAGEPYWAWSGEDAGTTVGGDGDPGQNAVVFEPMTWSLAAFDAEGRLVGLSAEAQLTP